MTTPEISPTAKAESPVMAPLRRPKSAVAHKDSPLGMVAGLAGVGLLATIVFFSLSQGRESRARAAAGLPSATPAIRRLAVPPGSVMPAPPTTAEPSEPPSDGMTGQSPPAMSASTDQLRSPALVVDLADTNPAAEAPAAAAAAAAAALRPAAPSPAANPNMNADDRFSERVSGSSAETAIASRLRDTALIAPQGTVLPAILETAISSDLPGFVRAVVSRDVRGFDGRKVLIPRGSKLIGQYRSGVAAGQSRAFVVWSRLITPEGVSIDIGSPAADRLGRGGLDGETNSHFFRRFGSSILLSVLSAGLQASTGNNNGNNTAIVIGSQQQASNIASIALQKQIDIPDTIAVAQGTPIRVFVARDLDFSSVVSR